jgi:FixJ family two-component response regulator
MSALSPTILVIDDDTSFCTAIERLLRSAGYRALTFTSPEQFLANLPEDGPGCILLDLFMPGLSGLELQEMLAWSDRSWPIIFISGRGDVPSTVRAMKAGAVDFLTKPCEDEELLGLIEHVLVRDAFARAQRAELQELRARDAMLTPREHEVFCLVATGLLNKQIAAHLGTTVRTIKAHRSKVMEKLEVESVAELVKLADRLGIDGPVIPRTEGERPHPVILANAYPTRHSLPDSQAPLQCPAR